MVNALNGTDNKISNIPTIAVAKTTGCRMHSSKVFLVKASSLSIQAMVILSVVCGKLFIKTSAMANSIDTFAYEIFSHNGHL
jgi:hypothetical protein